MQEYWTQPATYDPVVFDRRFRAERLNVWIPHFIQLGDLAAHHRVLDIGCGTGGFSVALAQRLSAYVIGVDIAPHLLHYGRSQARDPLLQHRGPGRDTQFAVEEGDPIGEDAAIAKELLPALTGMGRRDWGRS